MINGGLKFIDLFAGIGGFRHGMELAGHKCVGFCEWDKYATASYISMHLITEEQRMYLATLSLKKRQKEILKNEYRNGEWYSDDIRNVDAGSIPRCDCWCFGAPCQDFSVAGKRAGLDGDRSSLIREVFRILGEIREEDRPEWLIYENVKGMLSSNRGFDFLEILLAVDELGYDIEWQVFNSKDWGVPQNRERVYTVGHLRRCGTRKIFPITGTDGENSISIIAHRSGYRRNMQTFSSDGITEALDTAAGGGRGHHVAIPCFVDMNYRCGISTTENARAIQARYYKGICGHKAETSGVIIPVLTPDRIKKRQNGRRFKEDGDPMFTLTRQDRHGVGIGVEPAGGIYTNVSPRFQRGVLDNCFRSIKANKNDSGVTLKIKDATKEGYSVAYEGDAIDLKSYCSKTRRGVVKSQLAGALDQDCSQGIFIKVSDCLTVYAVWYEKYQCYIAIRRLTPKECFRLQGWEDAYFEKAAFVNSDSQLYKQAGNGVTVNVVHAIGSAIAELEEK